MTFVRNVSVDLTVQVLDTCRLAFQVGVADPDAFAAVEALTITHNGGDQRWWEVCTPHNGRIWRVDADAGELRLSYRARLTGTGTPAAFDPNDELLYLRPSRYCESDRLAGFAERLFRDITAPADIVAAVSSWVGTQLEYVSGSSEPTDGAVDTLLSGRGVCRDFAHLAVALLRAKGLAARVVAVYAPGLDPMDFHAVAEALIEDTWYVLDPTLLAPRAALVRIATGRDATDTAFLSNYGGEIVITDMIVSATVDGALPGDDVTALVELG
jgi:transglutaminase-like putative cysteine protease